MSDRIQIKRDNANIWASVNPVLSDGEFGFERDTDLLKIGNGTTQWLDLPYLNQAGGGLTEPLPSLQFNTTAEVSVVEGQLAWNQADGTLDVGMQGGNVVQQVGLENYFRVKNQTGSTITNGTVVMANGAVGNSGRLLCTPALASILTPSIYTMGIATETILNGEDGFVTQFGIVRGIDTRGITEGETWVDGDILYASAVTAGRLTKVAPSAPVPNIIVAMVVHAHHNGQLFVRPTFSEAISELNDVQITSIQDKDVLTYSAADQTWKNAPNGAYFDIAGEALGGHRVVVLIAGSLYYANTTNLAHRNSVVGVSLGAVSVGAIAMYLKTGLITEPSWNWDINIPVYLSDNGLLTQYPTHTTGFVLIVGIPMSSTSINISFQTPIIL